VLQTVKIRTIKKGYDVKFLPISIFHHEQGALPKDLRSSEIRPMYFLESKRLYFLLMNFSRGICLGKCPKSFSTSSVRLVK